MSICLNVLKSIVGDPAQIEGLLQAQEITVACLQWDAAVRAATLQAEAAKYAGVATAIAGVAAFGGAIAAGALALRGVYKQVAANKVQSKIDRDQAIKRDTHLAAIDTLFSNIVGLSRLVDMEVSSRKILDTYLCQVNSISRVHATADLETIRLIIIAVNNISNVQTDLINRRSSIQILYQELKQYRNTPEILHLKEKAISNVRAYGLLAIKLIVELNASVSAAIISMRNELEFPLNQTDYNSMIKNILDQMVLRAELQLQETE